MSPRLLPIAAALLLSAGLAAAAPRRLVDAPRPVAAKAATPTPTPAPEVSPDSPRSAVGEYLSLCADGLYGEAARYLDLPPGESRGPDLARKLKAVLDRHLPSDLEKISPLPGGNREDGLPPEVEEIGAVPVSHGKREPIRLVRRERSEGPQWAFSRATVQRVGAWYDALPDRFLRDRLPDVFFRVELLGILLWQWITILAAFPGLLALGRLLGWGTKRALIRLAEKTKTPWDEELVRRLTGPISVFWTLALARTGLPVLQANAAGEELITGLLKALLVLTLFWALYRAIRVAADAAASSAWARSNPSAPSILTLGVRAGEVTIVILGVLAALSEVGIPVASVLAGLGIGGIALALAAQKTVENLFGSISLAMDRPLRVGDSVKIGDVSGTVETIGLRSTRIRTPDRTLVTIPNGKLAEKEIETFAVRDRIRLSSPLGLVFGTTSAQMRAVLGGVERVLRAHPKVWQEQVVVRFLEIGVSSLNIEVVAWIDTADYQEFQAVREELLLGFLSAVDEAGTALAFPTRTVRVESAENLTR